MPFVVIARDALVALCLPQLDPACGGVNRTAEEGGINKGFHQRDRMAVVLDPIIAEPVATKASARPIRGWERFCGAAKGKRVLLTTSGRRRLRCSSLQPIH